MSLHQINGAYSIQKIKKHEDIKEKLLFLIEKDSFDSINDGIDKIKKTSWQKESRNNEWQNYFLNSCLEEINMQYQDLGYSYYEIKNIWFQQYEKGDHHGWHSHPDVTFSNVYFLELPGKEMATEFIDPYSKKIIKIDCHEGDLITFPAYLNHRSPKNFKENKKTVIVFNSYAAHT